MKKQPSASSYDVAKYYIRCMRRYPGSFLGWILSVPLASSMNAYIPPLIIANILNTLTTHQYNSGQLLGGFGGKILLYFAISTTGLLAWRLVDFFMWRLEQRISQDIAEEIFAHLITRSADFHANHFGGSLVSQANKLMAGYVRVQDTTIYQAYPMLIGIVFAASILSSKAPWFALGLVCLAAVIIGLSILISRPISRYLKSFAAAESKQTGVLADMITNVMTVKGFARSSYEKRRFHGATQKTRRYLQRFAHIQQIQINALGFMTRVISLFSLIMAVVAVVYHGANIATAFLIFSYTSTIVERLFEFGNNSLRTYNRALSDGVEMVSILQQPQEVSDPASPVRSQMNRGEIDFANVTFTHNGSDDAIFEQFNLHISPGEKIGLVGHSGSGKTTFSRLLLRYSDIQAGSITIDNQGITSVTQEDLHRAIAFVPQEPMLFHRSIRENIGYGDIDASHADIQRVAEMAHAHEFISTLPQGYDTLVGERGVKLSGGQRQRVAIARAMLKDAPILVLDEATSALDSESEVLIQDALWKLM
ncbi:ABC transporter ATP-binding protein, partial [Candidatus Saccharibacteria bacterium]|nr:ABC transporter ATP-binding protein [Candidatus Saccharibacteria bacterium]